MSKQWLKFADQVILGAIRLYWDGQIDVSRIKTQRALLSEDSFEDAVEAAYGLAVRDLNQFFRTKANEGAKRGESFNVANYLKTNWTEIQSRVEDHIDYDEEAGTLEGIFEDIPAFRS